MAWRCSGSTNSELIDNLIRAEIIKTKPVAEAMRAVDRANYCVDSKTAYNDAPQSIGYLATISAPHMHAMCLELLVSNLKPGARVLDVGSGSGYLVSVMGEMVKPNGMVFGVEHIPELVDLSIANFNSSQHDKSKLGTTASIRTSDGRLGLPKEAPFDAIHVGAAAPAIPEALKQQLKIGGRLVVPVGAAGEGQDLLLITRKSETEFTTENVGGVVYVPLTDNYQLKFKSTAAGSGGGSGASGSAGSAAAPKSTASTASAAASTKK